MAQFSTFGESPKASISLLHSHPEKVTTFRGGKGRGGKLTNNGQTLHSVSDWTYPIAKRAQRWSRKVPMGFPMGQRMTKISTLRHPPRPGPPAGGGQRVGENLL